MTFSAIVRSAAAALAIAATSAAAADLPFAGQWTSGGPASCESDALTMRIRGNTIEQHEELCRAVSMKKISKLAESGYRLRLQCKHASQTSATEVILGLIPGTATHDELLVRTDLTSGLVAVFKRCSGARDARAE